jgi:hypothetical protein
MVATKPKAACHSGDTLGGLTETQPFQWCFSPSVRGAIYSQKCLHGWGPLPNIGLLKQASQGVR